MRMDLANSMSRPVNEDVAIKSAIDPFPLIEALEGRIVLRNKDLIERIQAREYYEFHLLPLSRAHEHNTVSIYPPIS